MRSEIEQKITELKKILDAKIQGTHQHILAQYSESDWEDKTIDRKRALTDHLSLLQNATNRIIGLYAMVDETKRSVHPLNEKEWLLNTEKEFQKYHNELEGLK
jgi:hypothetical protein